MIGDVEVAVRQALMQVAERHGIGLLEVQCMVDHVHMVLKLDDPRMLPSAMHLLKGASARSVFQAMPELKLDLGTESLWQRGYAFRPVDARALPTVLKYVRTQQARPEKYER